MSKEGNEKAKLTAAAVGITHLYLADEAVSEVYGRRRNHARSSDEAKRMISRF